MRTRIVVLGAGFGGLELTTLVSEALGDAVDLVLIDKSDGFVFGYSKLDVMFGRISAEHAVHPYRDLVKPGVRFVPAEVLSIDPTARRVETDCRHLRRGRARRGPRRRPRPGGDARSRGGRPRVLHGRRCLRAPRRARRLRGWPGRRRGHLHAFQVPARAQRDRSADGRLPHPARPSRRPATISLVMPFGAPIPPSPDASAVLLEAFAERGIRWVPDSLVTGLDPQRRVALLSDGSELAVRPVPRHPRPPRARGRRPLGHDGRRLDPGGPADARDRVPGRLRRR